MSVETVRRMTGAIAYRGPDDEGVWIDTESNVGLGHRRLAIVDLSPLGHQPMQSSNGRWILNYNGEIYNHAELRAELDAAGVTPEAGWRGHSDTEAFVEAIAVWGLEKALAKAVGMFAFALWDKKDRRLHLVRDRFGEKPLYYGWAGGDFVFASELKAIRAHPRFDNPVDRRALHLFAERSYVPAPCSIYQRIFKLEPGCILTISPEHARTPLDDPPSESISRYWSYRDVVRRGLDNPIRDHAEALDALDGALARSIRGQAVADVPVGAFLSGGIDSSTVVAFYQKHSSIPVRTFTIGFEEAGFNEADYARAVAAHLGTVHNERYVTVKEARDLIPQLPSIYDEPFADASQIPTHLVSRFAREQVTVALSGDGGDELFAGYNRHFTAPRLWRRLEQVPRPLRALAGPALGRLPSRLWQNAFQALRLPVQPHSGAKIQKALRIAGSARSFDDVYTGFLDEWSFEDTPVRGGDGTGPGFDMDVGPGASDTLRMMYSDATSYLPDDILCKVDRAAMAVSLETRVPFLDHRLAEVAARIPVAMKVSGGTGKQILRDLLYRDAPRQLFERPKTGFGIPVGEWIKGPLRPWAEELLDPQRLVQQGYLDPVAIRRRWSQHLSGARDSTGAMWSVLMFQAWLGEQAAPTAAIRPAPRPMAAAG